MRMRLHTVRLNHSANQNRKNNQLLLRNRLGEQLSQVASLGVSSAKPSVLVAPLKEIAACLIVRERI
jgi:hypothetical protein